MFEYLMPLLVMPTYRGTILDESYRGVVARQIAYGRQRGVPWGVSESGYNKTDVHLNYQYRAFGVPGLGFKRGLADDLVIAPYATALALMVDPEAGMRQPPAARAGGAARCLRILRSHRLHGRSPAAREGLRDRALLHGAPSWDGVPIACLPAARQAHAAPVRRRPAYPGHRAAATGARPKDAGHLSHTRPKLTARATGPEAVEENVRVFTTAARPSPEVQLLSNGTLPRVGHKRRRRLQPVGRPRGDPLARGPDLRSTGARSATSAT